MSITDLIFYFYATTLLLSALGVVTARNPVYSVLLLVLCFFSCAALWLLLEAEFLAIALVLVYVGAVMVLFLFVVMMLDINIARLREGFIRYLPFGAVIAVLMAGMLISVVGPEHFGLAKFAEPVRHAADYNNTRELGLVLYTKYVYPFEIAAVILLVAIVAAIALTLRRRPTTKYQKPEQQIAVKRDDRIRLVSMDAEKKK